MIHVTKLYPTQDATVFHAFGRVISGTCKCSFLREGGERREGENERGREKGRGRERESN